jgi:hypothetical protein
MKELVSDQRDNECQGPPSVEDQPDNECQGPPSVEDQPFNVASLWEHANSQHLIKPVKIHELPKMTVSPVFGKIYK